MPHETARSALNNMTRRTLYLMSIIQNPTEYQFRFRSGMLALLSELDDICASQNTVELLKSVRTRYQQDVDAFGACTLDELQQLQSGKVTPDLVKALGSFKEGLVELINMIEQEEGQ